MDIIYKRCTIIFLASCTQPEGVSTDLTNSDRFAQVKLEDGHLTGGALLAQETTTVTTGRNGWRRGRENGRREREEREREREREREQIKKSYFNKVRPLSTPTIIIL